MANPKLIPVPFANGGAKTTIPIARVSNDPAEMPDYNEGFPPITSTPVSAGGKAPRRPDFNGILNDITANIRHLNSGGFFTFDAAFAAKIGGYPKGAVLLSNDGSKKYVSLIDGNTSDFNVSVDATKWGKTALTEREIQDIAWGTNKISAPWAPLESPALTGMPTAPTATATVRTQQISTCEFTHNAIDLDRPYEAAEINIKMNGAQSVGLLKTVARGDHVHPTDTSRVAKAGDTMTGVLQAVSGTGVNAGIKASGDPDTGREWPADGTMQDVVNGVVRALYNQSGTFFYNSGYRTDLQNDGNLVLRDPSNNVLFSALATAKRADFNSSPSLFSGWRKVYDSNSPSGFYIEQWGSITLPTTSPINQPVTFPIAFPNGCIGVWLTNNMNSGTPPDLATNSKSQTGFTIYKVGQSVALEWFAIGY